MYEVAAKKTAPDEAVDEAPAAKKLRGGDVVVDDQAAAPSDEKNDDSEARPEKVVASEAPAADKVSESKASAEPSERGTSTLARVRTRRAPRYALLSGREV